MVIYTWECQQTRFKEEQHPYDTPCEDIVLPQSRGLPLGTRLHRGKII